MNYETKKCSICGEMKELSCFYTQQKYSKVRGNWTYYNPECKECTKNKATMWRKDEKNRDSFLASQKKRNKRFTKEMRENGKRRRLNGDHKRWQILNKDKVKLYNFYRIANKTHDITDAEWQLCKEFFNNSCAYCGISEKEAKRITNNCLHREHVDHQGSNGIENCVPACKTCNSRKWTFALSEWYTKENEIYDTRREEKIREWMNNMNNKLH